jgi:(1->4)-alpha-D-glucan 1-alpha-D-glucosylmutase
VSIQKTDFVKPPRATYRLQLQPRFTFDDAGAIADYLADLGISHVYLSPHLQAAPGSTHGYDVIDPTRVNEELGGSQAHRSMHDLLRKHGLGCVIDIVPNHMSISGKENVWWWDVLKNGPASAYASYFDIDWNPPEPKLRKRILLAVLGDHYGRAVESGELRLEIQAGEPVVRYHDQIFPVSQASVDAHLAEPKSITEYNDDPDLLDALLEQQNYRLAYWKVGGREIDYRRFFDIDTLIGVRVEDEEVFQATHELILGWVSSGFVQGLRVDHPDGLRDPLGYLERLRAETPSAWIVVEKILEGDEELRSDWPVFGTTGYDFLNWVTGVFIDPEGEKPFSQIYERQTGRSTSFEEVAYEKKHYVMREVLASDINRLTALFMSICEKHRRFRDFTRHEIHEAIREFIACLPVYRTYVRPHSGSVAPEDERYISVALSEAEDRRPDIESDLFAFMGHILKLELTGEQEAEFVYQLQQVSGPVMAKGVEDTAFYCYNRLSSLNDVGGDPSRFGVSLEEFHKAVAITGGQWPATMLATSTHDTKRSEDVRARIGLLSEIPERWKEAVERWIAINERHRSRGLPSRNDEYLLYQTLVGAHPVDETRAVDYLKKAAREAKEYTSWVNPDQEYEEALERFVRGALNDPEFTNDIDVWIQPLIEPGRIVSLSQTLIKLTVPGVPDFYQGCELWDLSLVDPDNRRQVDFDTRRKLLTQVRSSSFMEAWRDQESGAPKMWLIQHLLKLREEQPHLFEGTSYEPLFAEGPEADRVVAYRRGRGLAVVVPRFLMRNRRGFKGTSLDLGDGVWRNLLTESNLSGVVAVNDIFDTTPIAILLREDG